MIRWRPLCLYHIFIAAALLAAPSGLGAQSTGPDAPPRNQPATLPQPSFQDKLDGIAELTASAIIKAHGYENWRRNQFFQADFSIQFGERSPLEGTMAVEIHSQRVRMDLRNGLRIGYDGSEVWMTQTDATEAAPLSAEEARAHLFTWTQLLTMPFTLRERGVRPTAYKNLRVRDVDYDSFILLSRPELKPATQNWRIVLAAQPTHLLHGIVFELNHGDERGTICVTFSEYRTIGGTEVATKWTFWKWNDGIQGDSIGTATITNPRYVMLPSWMFNNGGVPETLPEEPPAAPDAE